MTDPAVEASVDLPDEPLASVAEVTAEATEPETPVEMGHRHVWGVGFWLAAGWLVLVLIWAIGADWLPLPDPTRRTGAKLLPPSGDHVLGTDNLQRDIFSRIVHGARVSVIISGSAVLIGGTIGTILGMAVGYFRGVTETIVMRMIDIILAFPPVVLLLAMISSRGQSLPVLSITVGFLSVPIYTRVARANTLAIVEREFVRTARTIGAGHGRILFREVLPNVLPSVAAFALVAMGVIIVLEGSLAFLGMSVPMPRPTWGGMIYEGKRVLRTDPMVSAFPAIAMFLTVLSLNFVGDALRGRFDVKDSRL